MTNRKYYGLPANKHSIWNKNMLNHDRLTVWFDNGEKWFRKDRKSENFHLGFTIHDGDCRTEEFDRSDGGYPVYIVHPNNIARLLEELENE